VGGDDEVEDDDDDDEDPDDDDHHHHSRGGKSRKRGRGGGGVPLDAVDGTMQGGESAATDAARASHLQSEGKIRETLFSPFNGVRVVPSVAFSHSFP
jgi:hypothetical protein